jgi:hypothetical protein
MYNQTTICVEQISSVLPEAIQMQPATEGKVYIKLQVQNFNIQCTMYVKMSWRVNCES